MRLYVGGVTPDVMRKNKCHILSPKLYLLSLALSTGLINVDISKFRVKYSTPAPFPAISLIKAMLFVPRVTVLQTAFELAGIKFRNSFSTILGVDGGVGGGVGVTKVLKNLRSHSF